MSQLDALTFLLLHRQNASYAQKVLQTQSANLIGYWQLNETAGAVANDSSPENNDGAYTGVDLANAAGPDGVLVPYWDGANDYCNIYSAGFGADFNPSELTVLQWVKVQSSGVWTDSNSRYSNVLLADVSNYFGPRKSSINNQLIFDCRMGGVNKDITIDSLSYTDWFSTAYTVSAAADEFKAYVNGLQVGSTQTGLGTWSGALATAVIGAASTTPTIVWHGWLAHAAFWNTPLTPAQILALATV